MKKLIIASLCVFALFNVLMAQETKQETKKDFSDILPQKGHFSLGMDMANFIRFIGNSNSANGTFAFPNYNMVTSSQQSIMFNPTIFGKYFLTDKSAVRLRLGIGINNDTRRQFIYDDVANLSNPLANNWLTEAQTVDVMKEYNTQVELGIGYEYRRTLWRVQGYAGAEVFAAYVFHKEYYKRGNAMSFTNQTPTTFDFTTGVVGNPAIRIMEVRGGNAINYGGAIFTGADLFLSKNISIGAEFDLFIFGTYTTEEVGIGETWKLDQAYVAERKLTPVNTGFDIQPGGFFNLNIYF
jgi:hypothetical protein